MTLKKPWLLSPAQLSTFSKLKNAVQNYRIGQEFGLHAAFAGKTDFQRSKCIFGTTALFAGFL